MVVIVTEKQTEWSGSDEQSATSTTESESTDETNGSDETRELYVTVVDTVSAQIIYRGSLLHASQPVQVSLIEHTIAVSYWNTHAQRYELSSIHLYEVLPPTTLLPVVLYLSVSLSVSFSLCLSLSLSLSLCLSLCLSLSFSLFLSLSLTLCLSVSVSICLCLFGSYSSLSFRRE
jgi:hypothetical protein